MDKILGGSSPPIRTKIYKNIYINTSKNTCPTFLKFAKIIPIVRMKGIKLFFVGCLTSLAFGVFYAANADDAVEAARAATRRGTSTTVVRQQPDTSTEPQSTTSSGISRSTNLSTTGSATIRDRTTSSGVTARNNVVVRDSTTRSNSDSATQTVSARTTSTVLPRATVSSSSVISVPSRTATTRSAVTPISRTAQPATTARTATTPSASARSAATTTVSRPVSSINRSATTASSATNVSRAATSANSNARVSRAGTLSAEEIINKDITTCREVYYSCMDEFCANKDTQLKRCACSSRVNEFDSVKEQLTQVEDKLLDFNQRLLTVNMDKEDAEAIFKPTEGEIAFQQEDESDSKKLLDEISKKLNTTFDTSTFDSNLAPISLSLNVDAAFDSVDSLAGASTTAKTGTALYSAALPVCREMALEVCSSEELDIVESGYQMAIEQDCNTVAKAYQTQQDLAREKIREGGALLDISRLNIYQERNSDDILTCKKKMLAMLTNTSVCGTDLQKCLDISGQYIDPSTGEAILTSNLVNLSHLITRPEGNQTWTSAPGNEKFVSYLNSKKMFLESATENCQDIADYVWDEFIEDALAQIKLAQDSKLEEVRQSCTTLTTQCLTDSAKSLEDFDARALSIFGVEADKTVKQMCAEVQNACTALLDTVDGGQDWNTGMTEIATDKTYETIMQTCREVGRSCIIQSCKSISGNFGLCENIQTSVNRKAIINRTACWKEVLECVASAGIDSINNITELQADMIDASNGSFYTELYGQYQNSDITNDELASEFKPENSCIVGENGNCIYDICEKDCGFNPADSTYSKANSDECQVCRLAEKVWGNCEAHPSTSLQAEGSHNKIKIPESEETLLSWFAKNTNTEDATDSCRDTSCGPGFIAVWDKNSQSSVCVSKANISDDGEICPLDTFWRIKVDGTFSNCCKNSAEEGGYRDGFGNCCLIHTLTEMNLKGVNMDATKGYWKSDGPVSIPSQTEPPQGTLDADKDGGLCLPQGAKFVVAFPLSGTYYGSNDIGYLFCIGTTSGENEEDDTYAARYPSGRIIKCTGDYIIVTKSGKYMSPLYSGVPELPDDVPVNFYRESEETENQGICVKQYSSSKWVWQKGDEESKTQCTEQSPKNWIMQYSVSGSTEP